MAAKGRKLTLRRYGLTNEKIQLANVQTRLLVVVARQLKQRETVLVGRKSAAFSFVDVDESAFNDEEDDRRLGRVIGDYERMGLACWLVNECAWPGDPVVLKVPPAAPQRISAHSSDVIVNAKLGAGKALEKNAEPS